MKNATILSGALAFAMISGCAEVVDTVENLGYSIDSTLSRYTSGGQVAVEVPFEQAVDEGSYNQYAGKNLLIGATYRGGGSPPPGLLPPSGYVAMKFCSPEKSRVCTNRILLPKTLADDFLQVREGQQVRLLGRQAFFKNSSSGRSSYKTTDIRQGKMMFVINEFVIKGKGKKILYNYDSGLVEEVQQTLNRLGYNAGKVDGKFGATTRQAIMNFQRDQSIKRTGKLDDATLAALGVKKRSGSSSSRKEDAGKSTSVGQKPGSDQGGRKTSTKKQAPKSAEKDETNSKPSDGRETLELDDVSKSASTGSKRGKTNSRVVVRKKADPFSETVGEIKAGADVEVLGIEGDWLRVSSGGVAGYVFAEFIDY